MAIKVECAVCGREVKSSEVRYAEIFNGQKGLVCTSCMKKFGFKPVTRQPPMMKPKASEDAPTLPLDLGFEEWPTRGNVKGTSHAHLRPDEISVIFKNGKRKGGTFLVNPVLRATLERKGILGMRMGQRDGGVVMVFSDKGLLPARSSIENSGWSLQYCSVPLARRIWQVFGDKQEEPNSLRLRISKDLCNDSKFAMFQIMGIRDKNR